VIVSEMLRDRAHPEEWRPRVRRRDGASEIELGGRTIRSARYEFVDLETILAVEMRIGIDAVLLCPWVALLYPDAEPAACMERCRIQNDALERLVAAGGGRVAALGAVPLQDPELAAAELAELRARGRLAGIEITAGVGAAQLGDPRFEPLWQVAEETAAVVFVHPTTRGFDGPAFAEYYLWNSVGNPLETTVAAAHMTMAGVMERHPHLRVLLAHGGGALLAVAGRLRHAHSFQPQAGSRLTESPRASIQRFHFDTVTHDPGSLRSLIDSVGAGRVLLGSDYPFDMADPEPVGTVRGLGLSPEEEAAVLGGNAARLLELATRRGNFEPTPKPDPRKRGVTADA
jgi:aminocarboxymuconate-semialdehyde decarboxylase